MLTSDYLPATYPLIADIQGCEAWLSRATLAEPGRACITIAELLAELEESPPGHAEYLGILEKLRVPAMAALAEQVRRLSGKSLPLSEPESNAFLEASRLTQALFNSYHRLLRASLNGNHPALAREPAKLAARTLAAGSQDIILHCLAKQSLNSSLWRRVHEAYALAESHGFADAPADDASPRETATNAYLHALLVMLAAPQGMTTRELHWLQRWSRRWAHKVSLLRTPQKAAHYAVDLTSDLPPMWRLAGDSGPNVRFLDTTRLGGSLSRRARHLLLGETPASLGLGKDCVQPGTGELLAKLIRHWCSAPATRQFPRRPATCSAGPNTIDVGVGFNAVHECIAGKPFDEERKPWEYSRRNIDQIHIFRHDHAAISTTDSPAPGVIEHWIPVGESANGFCVRRSGRGARIVTGQLVCLRPQGARRFIVTETRWGLQSADNLMIGARALPGLAQACIARDLNQDARPRNTPFRALLLPVGEKLPSSLIVPSGTYRAERSIEVETEGGVLRLCMKELLGRGHDYERVSFEFMA